MIDGQSAISLPMGIQGHGSIVGNGVVHQRGTVRVVYDHAVDAVAVRHIIRDEIFPMRIELAVSGQVDPGAINDVGGRRRAIGWEGGLGPWRESIGGKKRYAVAVVEDGVAQNVDLDRVD